MHLHRNSRCNPQRDFLRPSGPRNPRSIYFWPAIFGVLLQLIAPTFIHGAAPNISVQPHNQIVRGGTTVQFTVEATGDAPLSYQWQFNGDNLFAQTNSTLSLVDVQPTHSGIYAVRVSNAQGFATSQDAALEVCWEATQGVVESVPTMAHVPYGAAIKFDAAGNLYVSTNTTSSNGFTLTKLTPALQLAWNISLHPESGFVGLYLQDFAIDSLGRVFLVAVAVTNAVQWEQTTTFVWSYSPDGNLLWSTRQDRPGTANTGIRRGIAVNENGNAYISQAGTPFLELLKLDSTGQCEWSVVHSGRDGTSTVVSAPAVGPDGSVCIAAGQSIVLKYRPDGSLVWVATNTIFSIVISIDVTVDQTGDVILVRRSITGGAFFDRNRTTKLSADDGKHLWTVPDPDTLSRSVSIRRPVDRSNNIYQAVVAFANRSRTVSKLDPKAQPLWWVQFPPYSEFDPPVVAEAIFIEPDDSLRVAFHRFNGVLQVAHVIQNNPSDRPVVIGTRPLLPSDTIKYVMAGSTLRLEPSFSGPTPTSYQWRRDGLSLAQATNASFVITNIAAMNAGTYSLLVTGPGGCSVSPNTIVTVDPATAPRLENIENLGFQIRFTLLGETNTQYQIETSTDLLNWTRCCATDAGAVEIDVTGKQSIFVRAGIYVP